MDGLSIAAGWNRLGLVSGQSLQHAPALPGGRREERGRQGQHPLWTMVVDVVEKIGGIFSMG